MGIIICKKHGRQDFLQVCEHIYQAHLEGIKKEINSIPSINLHVCNFCFEKYGKEYFRELNLTDFIDSFKKEESTQEKEIWEFYEKIERRTICHKCFQLSIFEKTVE